MRWKNGAWVVAVVVFCCGCLETSGQCTGKSGCQNLARSCGTAGAADQCTTACTPTANCPDTRSTYQLSNINDGQTSNIHDSGSMFNMAQCSSAAGGCGTCDTTYQGRTATKLMIDMEESNLPVWGIRVWPRLNCCGFASVTSTFDASSIALSNAFMTTIIIVSNDNTLNANDIILLSQNDPSFCTTIEYVVTTDGASNVYQCKHSNTKGRYLYALNPHDMGYTIAEIEVIPGAFDDCGCPAGEYLDITTNTCAGCPAGWTSAEYSVGKSSCIVSCPAGQAFDPSLKHWLRFENSATLNWDSVTGGAVGFFTDAKGTDYDISSTNALTGSSLNFPPNGDGGFTISSLPGVPVADLSDHKFTVAFFFKTDLTSNAQNYERFAQVLALRIMGSEDQVDKFMVDDAAGQGQVTLESIWTDETQSNLNHFAFLYDKSSLTVYFNGIEKKSLSITWTHASNSNTLFDYDFINLGTNSGQGKKEGTGWFDDLRIYDRVLTVEEIQALAGQYNAADDTGTELLPCVAGGGGLPATPDHSCAINTAALAGRNVSTFKVRSAASAASNASFAYFALKDAEGTTLHDEGELAAGGGGAPLVLSDVERKYPPAALTGDDTTLSASADITYGTGRYIITTGNSDRIQLAGYKAFDQNKDVAFAGGGDEYSSSDGNYNPHHPTDGTTIAYLVSGYNGDFVTIQLPMQILLTRYKLIERPVVGINKMPGEYKIYGSNDGYSWDELVHQANRDSVSYSGDPETFEEQVDTDQVYDRFGLVVNRLKANEEVLQIGEWGIFGKEVVSGGAPVVFSEEHIYPPYRYFTYNAVDATYSVSPGSMDTMSSSTFSYTYREDDPANTVGNNMLTTDATINTHGMGLYTFTIPSSLTETKPSALFVYSDPRDYFGQQAGRPGSNFGEAGWYLDRQWVTGQDFGWTGTPYAADMPGAWIKIEMPLQIDFTAFQLYLAGDAAQDRGPKQFKIYGSNTGSTNSADWELLHDQDTDYTYTNYKGLKTDVNHEKGLFSNFLLLITKRHITADQGLMVFASWLIYGKEVVSGGAGGGGGSD